MKGVFVAGTDTGVGKTLVAAGLAFNWDAHYWKPIQTGAKEGTDSEWVSRFLEKEKVLKEFLVLKEPLSPNQAADIEGKVLRLSDIQLHGWNRIQRSFDCEKIVVEGAGGVFVPMNKKETMMDLIKCLKLPVLLVARRGLGTLNHSLLSIEALRSRDIPLLGLVLVGSPHLYNRDTLETWSELPVLLEVDWKKNLDSKFVKSIDLKREFFSLVSKIEKEGEKWKIF